MTTGCSGFSRIAWGRSGVGTHAGGMSRLQGGQITRWTTHEGLGSNHVLCFYEDRGGALWIGTHGGGLCRLKDGRLKKITRADGLYDDLAFVILEDDGGNLWMSGNKGIYRASLAQLNDFADGRRTRRREFFVRQRRRDDQPGLQRGDPRRGQGARRPTVVPHGGRRGDRGPAPTQPDPAAGDGRANARRSDARSARSLADPSRPGRTRTPVHRVELVASAARPVPLPTRRVGQRVDAGRRAADRLLHAPAAGRLPVPGPGGQRRRRVVARGGKSGGGGVAALLADQVLS